VKGANILIGAFEKVANAIIRLINVLLPKSMELALVQFERIDAAALLAARSLSDIDLDLSDDLDDTGDAADEATDSIGDLSGAIDRLGEQMKRVTAIAYEFRRWVDDIIDQRDPWAKAMDEVSYQTAKFDEAMQDMTLTGDELVSKFSDMASTIRGTLGQALSYARQELSKVQGEFDSLQSSVAGAITRILSLRDAIQVPEDESKKWRGFVQSLGEALGVFDGDKAAPTFIDRLREQAERAEEFGERVRTLLKMGLSREAIQEILAAGYETGMLIADEIIEGGQTIVDEVNRLYEATTKVANEVGREAAEKFFGAGVRAAQALVTAIEQTLIAESYRIEGLINQMAAQLQALNVLAGGTGGDSVRVQPLELTRGQLADAARLNAMAAAYAAGTYTGHRNVPVPGRGMTTEDAARAQDMNPQLTRQFGSSAGMTNTFNVTIEQDVDSALFWQYANSWIGARNVRGQ
jgi:methyl-accepting chemotaxis protein